MDFTYDVIDHVQLAVPLDSEEKVREFYGKILLFAEVEKPRLLKKSDGLWFEAGNVHIHIGMESNFVPAKKAHPAIHVINIDALITHLKEKNMRIKMDNRLPESKRFYIEDHLKIA